MISTPEHNLESNECARTIMLKLVEAGKLTLGVLNSKLFKIGSSQVTEAGLSDMEMGIIKSYGLLRTDEEDDFEIGFGGDPEMHVEITNSPTSTQISLSIIVPTQPNLSIDAQMQRTILTKLIHAEILRLSTLKDLSLQITVATADSVLTHQENAYLITTGLLQDTQTTE